MDELAMWVGYVTIGFGVFGVIGGLALVVTAILDDAVRKSLLTYRDRKVFRQFLEWYEAEQKKKEHSAE